MRTTVMLVLLIMTSAAAAEAAPCRAEGRWQVTWWERGQALPLRSVRPAALTLVVAPGTDAVDGGFDGMTPARTDATARVDRRRCRAAIALHAEIDFADDAGNQDERLRFTVDLRGEGGAVRGDVILEESGSHHTRRRSRVVGRARRIADE